MTTTDPRSHDHTYQYSKDISKYSLLTKEEEVSLSTLAQSGDLAARNRLITSNLRLVIKIARKYMYKDMLIEDIIAEGNIGLFHAARKFDPTAGFRFSTYATIWINQRILRSIESSGRIRIPSYMQFIRKRLSILKQILAANNEHNIPLKNIIKYAITKDCKVTQAVIEGVIKANSISSVTSIDTIMNEPSEGNVTLSNNLSFECINEVNKIIKTLPERTRQVLHMRFGMGEYEHPMTLKEISETIKPGITRERVRQIIFDAVADIKLRLKLIGIDDWDET